MRKAESLKQRKLKGERSLLGDCNISINISAPIAQLRKLAHQLSKLK